MKPIEASDRAAITIHAQSYDPLRGCPQCSGVSHDRWMPALDEYYAYLPERVTRSCRKCGFEWWELAKQWWQA